MTPIRIFSACLICAFHFLAPTHSEAQSPAPAVAAEPPVFSSVVEVESHGIKGHGVVLTDSGLILTSFRLVAGGLDLKVRLSPQAGGVEVPDVEILKVHPQYDLALLQGKAPFGGRFAPATVVPKGQAAEAGLRCHAVTFPEKGAPAAGFLRQMVVTSPDRTIENLSYVQLSLGDDLTGAPVCDERGRVFAIITRTLEQSADIGLAISTQKLNMTDFVPVKDRPINKDLAVRSSHAAVEASNMARQSTGSRKEQLFRQAIDLGRFTLVAEPNLPLPYRNLGLDWEELGQPLIARRWFEEGLKTAPGDVELLHGLGVNLVSVEPKDPERAVALWRRGMAAPPDKEPVEMCARDLAVYALNLRRPAAAGYMLRWGFSAVSKTSRRSPSDSDLQQEIDRTLPQDELAALRRHDGPFILAVYDDLLSGSPFSAAVKKAMLSSNPVEGAAVSPGVKVSLPGPQEIERQQAAHAARFQPQLAPVPPVGRDFPLPSGVRQILPASSGWQSLFVFSDFPKIGVFNLASGKFDGFIDCPDPGSLCAAGGNVVAIYSPSNGKLSLHDLTTLQKTATHTLTVKGVVKFIGLGLYNDKQLFVVYDNDDPKDPSSGEYLPALVDLSTMAVSYPPVQRRMGGDRPFGSHPKGSLEANMDETGAICSMCCRQVTSSQSTTMILQPDGRVIYDIRPGDLRDPRPTHGGLAIVTRNKVMFPGEEFDSLAKADSTAGTGGVVPIIGYPGIVGLISQQGSSDNPKGFRIYSLPSFTPVREHCLYYENMHKLPTNINDDGYQLVASYAPDRMAFLIFGNKQGRLLPLGLKGDGVTASPGKKFERQVDIPANMPVRIKDPLPGMSYDPARSTLIWDVPADTPKNQAVPVTLILQVNKAMESPLKEIIRVQ